MSKDRTVPPPDTPIDAETAKRLIGFGFDPGLPVYDLEPPGLTLDDLKRSLFESTYQAPVTVKFASGPNMPDGPLDSGVEVQVELVQLFFLPFEQANAKGVGCHPEPQWYLRGFAYKSAFDPYPETIRVHAVLECASSEPRIDKAYLQLVREPSGADPSTPMVFAGSWHEL
jgi:hypothetical protein